MPNERQWLSILVAVNSARYTMPNYYVFKGKRSKQEYISLCEDGACVGMQENGLMDAHNFSTWISFFISHHKRKGSLGST